MPVFGKRSEEQAKTREIKKVKVTLIHPSTILPKRQRSYEVIESVKRDGVQQPIIVRPHPTIPNEYEVIDGDTRRFALKEKPDISYYIPGRELQILVDIRYGLTDSDVFKLAHTLHQRKDRNTYEQAEFYAKWVDIKAKELGSKEGALTAVAKELINEDPDSPTYNLALNSKQSLLSQYLKVYELLNKLEQKYLDKDFNALKSIGLNRLYLLTNLLDNMPALIKVVEKLLKNPNMSIERLKELVKGDKIIERKTPWSAIIRLPPDLTKNFHDALYKYNPQVFESKLTNNEILKQATLCLIKTFISNPEDFEVELEKSREEGYKISAIWMKIPKQSEISVKLIPKT